MNKTIDIIGVQMDLGAVRKGVDMGPSAIRHSGLIKNLKNCGFNVNDKGDIIPPVEHGEGSPKLRYEKEINISNEKLYTEVSESLKSNNFPVVLGGDHCIAAGSVSASCDKYDDIGVIWIDAHGDFNDENISPTGNMHGMPLSAVCGMGPDSMVSFSKKRVNPKRCVIIGARELDPLEKIKLRECGVTVFPISVIHIEGIKDIVRKAIEIAGSDTKGIHLSFDMDALDPQEAPGVGTPVSNGLTQREAFIACELLAESNKLIAIDLVETNPLLDEKNKTGILAGKLILTCLGSMNIL